VGLSPVSVVSHCEQVTPPYTPWAERNSRDAFFRERSPLGKSSDASARLGAWHTPQGRTATPPVLSLPGPFVTAHYWTTLAAYLSEESSSKEFWTGTDLPR
jgi:hypothetical protein